MLNCLLLNITFDDQSSCFNDVIKIKKFFYFSQLLSNQIIRNISIEDIRIVIEYTLVFSIVKLNLYISYKTKID